MAEQLTLNPVPLVIVLAIGACAATWAWIIRRWRQRQPVAPYRPRRPVPWHGIDLVLILAFYLAIHAGMIGLAGAVLGPDATEATQAQGSDGATAEHAVSQLITEGDVWILLLSGLSAVIVAPLIEEFFFRVLLQGWLETVERRWRPRLPTLRRLVPRGIVPIVLVSLLFARMHFRVDAPRMEVRVLAFQQVAMIVSGLLALALAVSLLRWRTGATAADLGWAPKKITADLKLGLAAFLAVAVPIYAMQVGLRFVLPPYMAPDPFPLFFFALALGVLYYRTHRVMPVMVVHAVFNGTSLALLWLGS